MSLRPAVRALFADQRFVLPVDIILTISLDSRQTFEESRAEMQEAIRSGALRLHPDYTVSLAEEAPPRAVLRERIARVLHHANTGSIVPDKTDPTKYAEMAEALLDDGWTLTEGA